MERGMARSLRSVLLTALAAALAVSGCGRADRRQLEVPRGENAALRDSVRVLEQRQALLKSVFAPAVSGLWDINWEGEGGAQPRLVLARRLAGDEATPRNLARELDRDFAPGIEYVLERDATVYLRIRDAELLTQRSGSLGAAVYLARATFSMTSIGGIDRVHFDFPEGDHAAPGYYSRASFLGLLGLLQ